MQKDEILPGELCRYASELKAAVEVICSSPPFRTSAKSGQFLRHIVQHTLDGNVENSKSGSSASCCWAAKPPTTLAPMRAYAFVQTMCASGWPLTTLPPLRMIWNLLWTSLQAPTCLTFTCFTTSHGAQRRPAELPVIYAVPPIQSSRACRFSAPGSRRSNFPGNCWLCQPWWLCFFALFVFAGSSRASTLL